MSVLYERCPCSAEFRVEVDAHKAARADLATWRTNHRHEYPPADHYADHTGAWHDAGFLTGREGRIEEVK